MQELIECQICKKKFKVITWKHLFFKHNMTIEEYDEQYGKQKHGCTNHTEASKEKFLNTIQKKGGFVPWNKGLKKEDHPSIMRYAESRKGENNPCHKIKDREKWIENIKKGCEEHYKERKGKTFEEFFGEEKSQDIKKKQSYSAKKRKVHGHTGKEHSEETKQILREKTAQRISRLQDKVSKPQKKMFKNLLKRFPSYGWKLEYVFGFYSLDIAEPNLKLAIEVDGDFYHVNEEQGFEIKYDIQRRNKRVEKAKSSYLVGKNWNLLRIWESDINKDLENVLEKIKIYLEDLKNDK